MEPIKLRELKHIVSNFSIRKKASGYRIDSKSFTNKALHDLIDTKLIEPVDIDEFFIYLRPVRNFFLKLTAKEKQQLGIPLENLSNLSFE